MKDFLEECSKVDDKDPILIIFTTGSTGFPKPAMITNIGITCQNLCLAKGIHVEDDDIIDTV